MPREPTATWSRSRAQAIQSTSRAPKRLRRLSRRRRSMRRIGRPGRQDGPGASSCRTPEDIGAYPEAVFADGNPELIGALGTVARRSSSSRSIERGMTSSYQFCLQARRESSGVVGPTTPPSAGAARTSPHRRAKRASSWRRRTESRRPEPSATAEGPFSPVARRIHPTKSQLLR